VNTDSNSASLLFGPLILDDFIGQEHAELLEKRCDDTYDISYRGLPRALDHTANTV
jgi:hypothetical protein